MNVGLLDDEKWQKLDQGLGHISEHPEDHDFKKARKPHTREELRAYVTKYLVERLAKKLNVSSITSMPWSKMKVGDILNWPSDVEVKAVYELNTNELQRLHTLVKEDLLDFSPQCISRLRSPSALSGEELKSFKSYVTKYLKDKLANRLNVFSIKVPWSQLKAGDILNWPTSVEFKVVDKMNKEQVKRLYSLAKQGDLDFSPAFINRFGKSSAQRS